MSDEDIDETERAEAEALAHALDRGSAQDDLPEDALQTAALLRYSAGAGELPGDREEAVLAEVLAAAEKAAAKRTEAPREEGVPWWRWLFGIGGVAALVALALFLWIGRGGPATPTALPTPSASLIGHGLERLAPGGDDAAFRSEMRDYRASVYDALSERYER